MFAGVNGAATLDLVNEKMESMKNRNMARANGRQVKSMMSS